MPGKPALRIGTCSWKYPVVIFRLHGRGREDIEKETGKIWNRIIVTRDAELAANAAIIKDLSGSGKEIYLNVNNHYEGSAPLTIERLQNLLYA